MARIRRSPVVLPTMEGGPGRWLRGIRFSGFTLTVLFLMVASLVVLAPTLRTIVEQQSQISELEKQNRQARDQVGQLQDQVDQWQDPAFLKAQARDRLLYAFPGDVTYLVIDDLPDASTSSDGLAISKDIQTAKVDWAHSALSSVFTAGLTERTPEQLVSPTSGR